MPWPYTSVLEARPSMVDIPQDDYQRSPIYPERSSREAAIAFLWQAHLSRESTC
jgi:hypothetical protein